MNFVDAHCHLEPHDFPNIESVIERARASGLTRAVLVGQFHEPGNFGAALQIAQKHPEFFVATMGIHPHEVARATDADWVELERLCALPDVRAVGEAGLDYYYDRSPREVQVSSFARQCALAVKLNKPLVVHVRDAHQECYEILKRENVARGVIHCFTGDRAAAERYLSLGLSLSISGIVTYKKTEGLHEAVKLAPLERLMVETDSPFLAPVPHRGKKNEPAWVVEVAKKVAELKGVSLEQVAQVTSRNAAEIFRF
jgi:TatD DNase family protein